MRKAGKDAVSEREEPSESLGQRSGTQQFLVLCVSVERASSDAPGQGTQKTQGNPTTAQDAGKTAASAQLGDESSKGQKGRVAVWVRREGIRSHDQLPFCRILLTEPGAGVLVTSLDLVDWLHPTLHNLPGSGARGLDAGVIGPSAATALHPALPHRARPLTCLALRCQVVATGPSRRARQPTVSGAAFLPLLMTSTDRYCVTITCTVSFSLFPNIHLSLDPPLQPSNGPADVNCD